MRRKPVPIAQCQGPEAARRFEEIAFGKGLSVAGASRQWLASVHGKVREGTWHGYEASVDRLGVYLATHEGAPSLAGVGLSSAGSLGRS
jgi:hypothetical protein